MSSELRYCPSCQKDVLVADYHLSVVCTVCGRELEANQVSLSLEHMDKSYVDSRNQIRDTSSALAYVGTNRGGNRPIADRQQLYKNKLWVVVRRICRGLRQSDEFVHDVKQVANKVLTSHLSNPGITRLVPACIYMVSRNRKTGLSLLDVADACEVAPFLVGRWYRRLIERLGVEPPSERTPALIVDECVCKLINETTYAANRAPVAPKIAQIATFPPEDSILSPLQDEVVSDDWDDVDTRGELGRMRQRVITAVQRVIKMASDQLLISGRHPGPIAAAATHLVVRSDPSTAAYKNLKALLLLAHSTQRTIEKRMAELKSLLLKAAHATLPWATNITIQTLEENLPNIITQLDVEAKVKSAKIRFEQDMMATEDTAEESNATKQNVSTGAMLPKIVAASSRNLTAPAISESTSKIEVYDSEMGNGMLLESSLEIIPNTIATGPSESAMQIDSILVSSSEDFIRQPYEQASESSSTSTVAADSWVVVPMPPAPAPKPAKPKYAVKLGPSTLSKIFHVTPHTSSQPSPRSITNSSSIVKKESAEVVEVAPIASPSSFHAPSLASSTSTTQSYIAMAVSNSLTEDEKKWIDDKTFVPSSSSKPQRATAPSFAPAYLRSASVKARRAEMIARAKKRLAKLAHSLPPEEAEMFGLSRFREMPADHLEEENDEQPEPVAVPEKMANGTPKASKISTDLTLEAAARKKQMMLEEEAQIEQLLMEGVSEERIVAGYLDTQVLALDTHYNAVTVDYTDCTEGLIRTDEEVELRQLLQTDLCSSDDDEEEDEKKGKPKSAKKNDRAKAQEEEETVKPHVFMKKKESLVKNAPKKETESRMTLTPNERSKKAKADFDSVDEQPSFFDLLGKSLHGNYNDDEDMGEEYY